MQTISDSSVRFLTGVSPLDGSPLADVPISTAHEIAATVTHAKHAQTQWAALPIAERARILKRAGQNLMAGADELSRVLHSELGKPVAETYVVDMGSIAQVFQYYTRHAARLLKSEPVRFNPVMFPGKRATVERVPHGVVALLTPWNYPVSIPIHNLVPALIAGNAVVMKPSEFAARTGAVLYRLLTSELPEGLLGLVQGDSEQGETLVRSEIDHVVFVGGLRGGKAVAKAAADNVTPVALELGGKDAAIVLEDVDLDRAAHGIAWAGFLNAGQSCAGVERVYVVQSVATAFTERLVKIATDLQTDKDIGPLSTAQQFQIVKKHVEDALNKGAKLVCGGVSENGGQYYKPTVLTDVNCDMLVMQEETFGPIVPIQVVKDAQGAVQAANQGEFGLTGSVWTRDLAQGERLARQLKVGVASVNNHMFSGAAPQAAWTGSRKSGYGVQNSKLALYGLTRPRLLAVDGHTTPRELWWFPYDQPLTNLGQGLLRTEAGLRFGWIGYLVAYAKMLRGVAFRWVGQYRR